MNASIVIRAYNAEKTIVRAIESALAQKHQGAYEILIVNDGSTDHTLEIVERYVQDHRIRVISHENRGLIGASNTGFSAAKGEIVMLLDADDEALPDLVSNCVTAFTDRSVDYAYGEYFEEYEGVKNIVRPSSPFQAPAGAYSWRREKLMDEGGFAGDSIFPEYEILLRTWGGWKVVCIDLPLFIYHRSISSMTGNRSKVSEAIDFLLNKFPARAAEIADIRSYEL